MSLADVFPDLANHQPDQENNGRREHCFRHSFAEAKGFSERIGNVAGQVDRIVADRDDRQAFNRFLQAQLQIGSPVHAFQEVLILRLACHVDTGAQKAACAERAPCHCL